MAQLVIIFISIVLLLLITVDALMSFRKRKFKGMVYSLKNSANNIRIFINMFVAFYILIGMTYLIGIVNKWAYTQEVVGDVFNNLLVHSFPIGLGIFAIWISIKIFMKGVYPILKYNDEEKQWRVEDKNKENK